MRTEQPKNIRLCDYQVPDYLIDETHLTFDLYEDHALVHAQLVMRRNPQLDTQLPALTLVGQQLQLEHLAINDQVLSAGDYQLTENDLTLQPTSQQFTIDSTVRIEPQNNTALEGLYKSGKMFCTQCEAEGFRKITYYLDRPDVMSCFTTTINAEQPRYPVLLSNGNLIAEGHEPDGRHWATWQDPFPKPAYLFALVAGDLWCVEDKFSTMREREVTLRIFVEPENIDKCQHAMNSLKKAMRWDEQVYGREYDLDIFMIVAVNDFNMGAMENKGLNIFNSSCVLAKAETATDAAFQRVEGVVAHEYFHNWSGNRVTCRDWFQLSLKEGFTVFRDSEFSADMNSRPVKRIEDVAFLRTHQFAEDAGPMAHPVRPAEYMEISNFYTVTIYEKGAEVVRMIHTLLGKENFRKGSDLYFQRHDGQAVTCDDFVAAMQDASGIDLSQFKRWYSQAGTPCLEVRDEYDAAQQSYTLHFKQSCPATPGQEHKDAFVIPVKLGLIAAGGRDVPLQLADEAHAQGVERVIAVSQAEQSFTFINVPNQPIPSLLRGFSAPVRLRYPYTRDQLMFLMANDSDSFNRWEAGQQLAIQVLNDVTQQIIQDQPTHIDPRLIRALHLVLADRTLDPALVAQMFTLPSEAYLIEQTHEADAIAICKARELVRKHIAASFYEDFRELYLELSAVSTQTPYEATAEHFARRSLQHIVLSYALLTGSDDMLDLCTEQFETADNMTERLSALSCLVNSTCQAKADTELAAFSKEFAHDPLVMDLWFSVQASSARAGNLEHLRALMAHDLFSIKNPNKVRAVIGAFANQNLINFHADDGSGYAFLADQVIKLDSLNPQIAARMLTPLTRWRNFKRHSQQLMRAQLERIKQQQLSADVFEVVTKSLA